MNWELLAMEGPLFHGDILYNSICALVIFLVGSAIWFKSGNRVGWLFVAAAVIWTYLTFKELLFM